MSSITVGGKTYRSTSGGSISIINNRVYIDGKLQDETDLATLTQPVEIVITGDPISVSTEGSVIVNGNVGGDVKTMGAVEVSGDVGGSVKTMGSVRANNVKGKIDTMGKVTVNSRG